MYVSHLTLDGDEGGSGVRGGRRNSFFRYSSIIDISLYKLPS